MEKSGRARSSNLRTVAPTPAVAGTRESSRMMGLLIVDVLAARKVDLPAPKPKRAKKAARG